MQKFFFPLLVLFIVLQLVSLPTSTNAAKLIYFDEPKEGFYEPLHPYTLQWSGNVLADGGLNLTEMKLTKDASKADVVMNSYDNNILMITSNDIGANAIIDLGTNADLTSPIDPSTFTSKWKTFFKISPHTTYLIKTHDNKYAKIRIDDILPTKIFFTYVMETDAPVQETWKDLGVKSDLPTKQWTISFSKAVDPSSVTKQNIYVTTENGATVNVGITVSKDDPKKVLVHPPTGGYEKGKSYFIYVKNIKSKVDGKLLKENVKMKFTIKDEPTQTPLPNPPTNVTATPGDGKVSLRWTDSTSYNINGYYIYFSTDGVNFSKLYNSSNNSYYFRTTQIDIKATNGQKVYVYLTAVDFNGKESAKSNTVSVTPTPSNNSNLVAPVLFDTIAGNGSVKIDWYDLYDPDLRGYYVYVSEQPNANFQRIDKLITQQSGANISGLTNGVTYYFYVTALYKNGESNRSNIMSDTPTTSYTSWAGSWTTDYGQMELVQDGNKVTGYYDYGNRGTIEGIVEGKTLKGTFYENWINYGKIEFILSNDGQKFTGHFQYDGGIDWGTWDGERLK